MGSGIYTHLHRSLNMHVKTDGFGDLMRRMQTFKAVGVGIRGSGSRRCRWRDWGI